MGQKTSKHIYRDKTSELEEETSKHAWTKRPNIHHCAKVIGISKKTQFERMFLFSLQFFLHRICRLMTSASSNELSVQYREWPSFCFKTAELFWKCSLAVSAELFLKCYSLRSEGLPTTLPVTLVVFLSSFDLNGPRSLQRYSNPDYVAAIP